MQYKPKVIFGSKNNKRKLPVTVILGDSIVKGIKGWKMSSHTRKVVVKNFSGAKLGA